MAQTQWQAEQFEVQRAHLRGVAYRMLGSLSEADDAVQEAWLRFSAADSSQVENLRAWLTTIVGRVALNMLRARRSRPQGSLDTHVPDPIVTAPESESPEQQALLADSVGLALQVVLESLAPAERLAFVLHDMFGVSFDEIAPMIERSPAAARKLASRARQRVRGRAPVPDADLARQRDVVDAFFAAAHDGDFDRLVAVLDPDVLLRSDGGERRARHSTVIHGAEAVASQALTFARLGPYVRPALVNGAAGVVVTPKGRPFSVLGFIVVNGRIAEIDSLSDPERLAALDLTLLEGDQA